MKYPARKIIQVRIARTYKVLALLERIAHARLGAAVRSIRARRGHGQAIGANRRGSAPV
jgi:hypothetical protein